MFFSEHWRNPKTYEDGTLPLTSVTQDVVTTPDLVLTVYDPNAKYIPEYRKTLRWGSWAEDWEGPTCLRGGPVGPPNGSVRVGVGPMARTAVRSARAR